MNFESCNRVNYQKVGGKGLESVKEILINFISDEVRKFGFKKGIIGLSGGVDSAVSAYLTVEALGVENVVGVMMPYRASNPTSLEDAKLVAKNLGIKTILIDISPMVEAYSEMKEKGVDRIRRGNFMARIRMAVLYDISCKEKGLVVGTGNKTETLLGYTTLYGDSACAINPLGDLYKTQVWRLAKSLGVPKRIIEKPPSADLWAGQTDEGELGVNYILADKVLYSLFELNLTPEELILRGYEADIVYKIVDTIRKTQYKRVEPIIAKVSTATVGKELSFPRDWGT
ncbi:MAG: NAD(+) synthetase [Thermotoga sp.]|nr:MAG: NAD(+) synthetase [Thermotoga sp.]